MTITYTATIIGINHDPPLIGVKLTGCVGSSAECVFPVESADGFELGSEVVVSVAAKRERESIAAVNRDLLAACENYLYGRKDARECEAEMREAIAKARGHGGDV